MNFAFSRECAVNGKWDELAHYLSERALALERAGADFIICASNTLHRVADKFTCAIKIPFLHIVDPTAKAILDAGLKRVGLLGTKTTMSGAHLRSRYTSHFGIEIEVPPINEQHVLDEIIFEELCRGEFTTSAKEVCLGMIDRLQAEGAEGVVLGCTEIPLLVKQDDRVSLPMFDTVGLHVAAALRLAAKEI